MDVTLHPALSNRVAQTVNGVTTYFVGAHYELTGSQVTKYYGVYPELVEGRERKE